MQSLVPSSGVASSSATSPGTSVGPCRFGIVIGQHFQLGPDVGIVSISPYADFFPLCRIPREWGAAVQDAAQASLGTAVVLAVTLLGTQRLQL